MKNIVIAAGYATRLYPLTENFPKPLLKIGERSILDRILDDVDGIEDIDEHIIVTNHKFAEIFNNWVAEREQSPFIMAAHCLTRSSSGNCLYQPDIAVAFG